MSASLTPVPTSDLYTWRSSVENLSPLKPPYPGLYGKQWQKTHAAMLDFLERFGAQAVELGWIDRRLFAVCRLIGTAQADHCSVLTLTSRCVVGITAGKASFVNLTC